MDELSRLIGRVYDCGLEEDDWSATMAALADYCGGANAALVRWEPRIGLSQVVTPRADPEVVADYGRHWWKYDPTAQVTAKLAPGRVSDLGTTGQDRFLGSRFHREYWSRSGFGAQRLASNLFIEGEGFGSVVLQTAPARDDIDAETRRRFAALVPHLLRSVAVRRRLDYMALALRAGGGRAHDGMIVLGREGHVLMLDAEAEDTLRDCPEIVLRDGRLRLSERTAETALDAVLARRPDAPPSGRAALRVPCRHAPAVLSVEIVAVPAPDPALSFAPAAAALVFLTHSERRLERAIARLGQVFDLTAAEARLTLEMAEGDGRAAAADRCGISVNTARTHLNRVFEKTGVTRQAELIRMLADLGLT